MNKITQDDVKKVAELARIELNEKEIENHACHLEKILEYINQLEKINTDDVLPTTRAIEVVNVLRKDKRISYIDNDELVNLAPSREDNFFKVPKIIKD